jgi:hypothetical protein
MSENPHSALCFGVYPDTHGCVCMSDHLLVPFQEECFRARRMALTWIDEIASLDLMSTMSFAPRIAAVVLPALSATANEVRETSISINQVLQFPRVSYHACLDQLKSRHPKACKVCAICITSTVVWRYCMFTGDAEIQL